MSLKTAGLKKNLWIFFLSLLVLNTCVADTLTTANSTRNDGGQRTIWPTTWRKNKLPVRPPRLKSQVKATTLKALPFISTSVLTTTEITTVMPAEAVLEKHAIVDLYYSNDRRRMDIIEPSSSEHHQRSVIWPVRQRPALGAKRFRAPTPTTPAPQVLLKLLQPKPTRPAIYSLDGFVPKPSLKKITSTTEPPFLYSKNDLQLLPSVVRKRKVNRFNKNDDDDDYYDDDFNKKKKPVSRYTAFARKGVPGDDYPVFGFIPHTEFQCREQPGLYADPYTNCQVWHMCPGGNLAPRHSFLCPNGTIFNQKKRICDWWYNVGCRKHNRNIRSVILTHDSYSEDAQDMNFDFLDQWEMV